MEIKTSTYNAMTSSLQFLHLTIRDILNYSVLFY